MCTCVKLHVEVKGEHWLIPQLFSNLFFMLRSLTNLKLICSTRLTSLRDPSVFASAGIMWAHHYGWLFMQVQRIPDNYRHLPSEEDIASSGTEAMDG